MTQPADTYIPATIEPTPATIEPTPAPVSTPAEPRTPQNRVMGEAFDLSNAISGFGREILETGVVDAYSIRPLVRRMAALYNAAMLAESARPGSNDADMVAEYIRNPHRMKGVEIL